VKQWTPPWTAEEDACVFEHLHEIARDLALRLGRTRSAVSTRHKNRRRRQGSVVACSRRRPSRTRSDEVEQRRWRTHGYGRGEIRGRI
jgi:hypothetical protein